MKKCICIVLIIGILFGISGCRKKEKPYPYGVYTRVEMLDLFENNRNFFDELVAAIMADTSFLENGNVEPDGSIGLTPLDDRYMNLFNDRSQNAIRKVFEFKPYMIMYEFRAPYSDVIWITFIGDGTIHEVFGFLYLVNQSNPTEVKEYISYLEQTYYVDQLSDGWIFEAKVLCS